jgi:Tol biopolymer transport system component
LGLGLIAYGHITEDTRVLKLSMTLPKKATFAGTTSDLAVSPDGRSLVFVAATEGKVQLWVRDLDSFSARPLPGTEGGFLPFWSPDSRTVAFQTLDAGGKLKRVDVAGGPAVNLREAPYGYGGTWAQDGSQKGVILFAPNRTGGLFRVPAAGGTQTPVTELDQTQGEILHAYPWFLPDGRHFLYTVV